MARRSSRKRRKAQRAPNGKIENQQGPAPATESAMARGYARSRIKDDAARAALEPLEQGERPTAVTVGAILAVIATVANLVALALAYDGNARDVFSTLLGVVILVAIAVGMWRSRYWAVLGMQALLAVTLILSSLALLTAVNLAAAALALALIAGCGTLFWFLVKAMARIQMPQRPGAGE